MNNNEMLLTYDDPLTAVFLRILAWEQSVGKRTEMSVGKDLCDDIVQTAREELGLKRNADGAGAPHDFVNRLRSQDFLDGNEPKEKEWDLNTAWRLKCLPSHRLIRMLSKNPVYKIIDPQPTPASESDLIQISIILRNPALPELLVTLGKNRPTSEKPGEVRGVYFLRVKNEEVDGLYIGQSDEFDVRWSQHTKSKSVKWWAFIKPVDMDGAFTFDALNAAESLLISFWNEVCDTTNKKRGHDKPPAKIHLQQGVLLATAASAAYLWLMRDTKMKDLFEAKLGFNPWQLPFKKCGWRGWPDCYLKPDNSEEKL
jgi:hypothetical protein